MAARKTTKTPKKTATKKDKANPKELLDQVRFSPNVNAPPAATVEATAEMPKVTTPQRELKTLPAKDQAIRAWINSANTKDNTHVVIASDAPNTYTLRRPTGIMELDIDLGGGFAAGGCGIISGPDNVGKSHLIFRTMAMQQRLYGNACRQVYAVTEGGFPFDQAIRAGCKIPVPDEMLEQWQEVRRLRNIPLYTKEQLLFFKQKIGDVYLIGGKTGEEVLANVIEAVRTNAFSLVACDSMQGLMPAANLKKEMTEEEKRAAHANMMKRFWTQYIPITGISYGETNYTTVLFTNQVRSNQERANMPSYMQQHIPEWSPAGGGHTTRHYKLVDLVLWDSKVLRKKDNDDHSVPIGKLIHWKTEKGKAGTHDNKFGEVPFYYELGGPDVYGELLASGIKRGVLQQRGEKMVVVQPDTKVVLDDYTAPSAKAMRSMIQSDFDFELAIRREILTAAGIQCLYR